MWLTEKKLFFALSLFCLFLQPVFSQGVYLTESEFLELMSIIRTSRANSEEQMKLIAGLRITLAAQKAELLQALNTLELSESDLTELRDSLSRIQTYLDELNVYCLRLEQENNNLKNRNRGLRIGIGASSGAAGILLIVLLVISAFN